MQLSASQEYAKWPLKGPSLSTRISAHITSLCQNQGTQVRCLPPPQRACVTGLVVDNVPLAASVMLSMAWQLNGRSAFGQPSHS